MDFDATFATQQIVDSLAKTFQLQDRTIQIISRIGIKAQEIDIKPNSKCACGLPFIYKAKYWKGKTPKEILEDWYRKNFPKNVPRYEHHFPSSTSYGSKVLLPHLKDENGRPKEIISSAYTTNKKESEQNAALEAIHFLHGK